MDEYKKDLMILTAKDIGQYISDNFGVDVDYLDLVEFINFNLGMHITVIEPDIDSEEEIVDL